MVLPKQETMKNQASHMTLNNYLCITNIYTILYQALTIMNRQLTSKTSLVLKGYSSMLNMISK